MEAMLRGHVERWAGKADRIGVLHCYTGSMAFAKRLLELGLYISFSGIVTFKNAAELREVAAMVPDDRLLIETDAPYLAPPPHRGRRNEPAYVAFVAQGVAEVRGCTVNQVADITSRNAARLFGWEKETA
jgi:TatD DNase family protein